MGSCPVFQGDSEKKYEVIINYKVDQAANPKQLSEHLVNQAIKENHVNQKLEIFFYSTVENRVMSYALNIKTRKIRK